MLASLGLCGWLAGVSMFIQGDQHCPLVHALGCPKGITYAELRNSFNCDRFSGYILVALTAVAVVLSTRRIDMGQWHHAGMGRSSRA